MSCVFCCTSVLFHSRTQRSRRHWPWSQRRPPQPSLQVHCQGCWQVPCLQDGCLLHSLQKVPCQPSLHLSQTKHHTFSTVYVHTCRQAGKHVCKHTYTHTHTLDGLLYTYTHCPGLEQFPFNLLHPSRQIAAYKRETKEELYFFVNSFNNTS